MVQAEVKSKSRPLKPLLGRSTLPFLLTGIGQCSPWPGFTVGSECAPACGNYRKQWRCAILSHDREHVVVNYNISTSTTISMWCLYFTYCFVLSSSSAEMKAMGSRYIFYGRAEFSFFSYLTNNFWLLGKNVFQSCSRS